VGRFIGVQWAVVGRAAREQVRQLSVRQVHVADLVQDQRVGVVVVQQQLAR
jgi:hypothetical protein